MRRRSACLALLLALAPGRAWSWSAEGHRLADSVGWSLLADDEPLRAKVNSLLARLPDADGKPHDMISAGTWMDDTRRRGIDDHWHYINLPFDGVTPRFAAGWEQFQGQEHAAWALDQARAALRGDGTAADKAPALARLLHLVAELHQPLHCAERGRDRGGNLVVVSNYTVERDGRREQESLHTFWDWAHGLFARDGQVVYDPREPHADRAQRAATWMRLHPVSPEAAGVLDSRAWAESSYMAACTTVYGRAPVNLGTATVVLPADYVDRARETARARLVLAGHRLAAQLRDLRAALLAVP